MDVIQTNEEIANFAVNASGTKMVVYSENGLLRLIDIATEKVLQITKLNSKLFPNDIAFSPDSRHIALGFSNQTIKIFTTESFKETHSYQHSAPVRHV
jgi:tricorn protease-like protein